MKKIDYYLMDIVCVWYLAAAVVLFSTLFVIFQNPSSKDDINLTIEKIPKDVQIVQIEPLKEKDSEVIQEEDQEEEEIVEEPEEPVYSFSNKGLVYANILHIRKAPTTDSEIIGNLRYETEIYYDTYDPEWYILPDGGYVFAKYIVDELPYLKSISGINDTRKSWMDYRAITSPSSQKELQKVSKNYYGMRTYNNRFCVATGHGICDNVGTYIDVILDNGTLIKCVVGDVKAPQHTKDSGKVGLDGSAIEFIVDKNELTRECRISGDISDRFPEWKSSVKEVRIYDYRVKFK